jgi:glutamate dehydrogenase (NADP+)
MQLVHFCEQVLEQTGERIADKRVAISGAGKVALYAADRALAEGARVMTLSDSGGLLHAPRGVTRAQLKRVIELKQQRGATLEQFTATDSSVEFHRGRKPWAVECDVAMPCATENELDVSDAKALAGKGVRVVCEGANMPCTTDAIEYFADCGVIFAPGIAANAGGVAVSGMELSQNAMGLSWSRERVDRELKETMRDIHAQCVRHGKAAGMPGEIDYLKGANLAGFRRVADAMLAYGVT